MDRIEKSISEYGSWEAVPNKEEIIQKMKGMMNLNPIKIKTKDSKTGEPRIKVIVPTFLADLNFRNKPLLNKAYDVILEEARNKPYEVDGEFISPEVIDIRTLPDTSLILSALLSAATDNAKELILSKINAGPELAGMYVSMIINGLSFDEITDLMVSPTVDMIVAESKSNIFKGESGSIDKAIKFFKEGPKSRKYLGDYHIQTLYTITNSNKVAHRALLDLIVDTEISKHFKTPKEDGKYRSIAHSLDKYLSGINDFDAFLKIIHSATGSENGIFKTPIISLDPSVHPGKYENLNFNFPMNRFLSEYKRRIDMIKSDGFDSLLLSTFEEQYKIANALTIYGRRLGINAGMKTSIEEHINHDYLLSDLFMDNMIDRVCDLEVEEIGRAHV